MDKMESKKRRKFGQHFTTVSICEEFILPYIKDSLYDYIWVDLFAGEGNLIFPILNLIPEQERISFFESHIYLFDIQPEWTEKSIQNAQKYGIPEKLARQKIQTRDCLSNYPQFLRNLEYPVYHVTNPPYLYLGYIVKTAETQKYLPLFTNENRGLQDLYQIALINDLRNAIDQMIYIIPSNFIFGNSVSNKIRDEFLPYYSISRSFIFEKQIFKHTGTNVMINFFQRNLNPQYSTVEFQGIKIGKEQKENRYLLEPQYHYKAGSEFETFITNFKVKNPVIMKYYLKQHDVDEHPGKNEIKVIDANNFEKSEYVLLTIFVDSKFANEIQSNLLWIRTVDTGTLDGRAGLYSIKGSFNASGILVTKATYRTHPIQIFFSPPLSKAEQRLLQNYFNLTLEYLRSITDSEFMTTYKYSSGPYTRKYFGLSQAKKIIATFPLNHLDDSEKNYFSKLIYNKDVTQLLEFLKTVKNKWKSS
ncbi:hypothetical protein NEF87_002972 [Candidatus Lokiarchaeum ossiferum]|uniref:DNA methylase adenine-specific domain-containing protein n=1 Tax=Candidatus Lokiarchaeum ossiferum TaxID=2951803 RepID=A0ABY6HWF4_9ARCH|nr:hypothetical protein NEF87_002972 [Candidatus Lokiarchaeum sp. B-35]